MILTYANDELQLVVHVATCGVHDRETSRYNKKGY